MDKLKGMLKVSERDKKLLIVVMFKFLVPSDSTFGTMTSSLFIVEFICSFSSK